MTTEFQSFGLPAGILKALTRLQFTTPTPIQAEAIPVILDGHDLIASAQTGTGKTGAFGIPLIAQLMKDTEACALILTPTRELAAQVVAALQTIIPSPNIKTALLIGGEAMPKQLRQLSHKPRVIVGTPGRVNDHLARGSLRLDMARFLVLDETDRMLDMGFGVQIEKIVEHMPAVRQTLLFSATLPKNIMQLSRRYLKDPKRIAVGSVTTPIEKIAQEALKISEHDKYPRLLTELDARQGSIIIFVKTKHKADRVAERLSRDNHTSHAIHGNLVQRKRDRVIQEFRDKKYRILVATDIAARGLDIPHIEHVVNYDLPTCPENYIHRIGRTARAGAQGQALNMIAPEDNAKWGAIEKLLFGQASSPDAARAPKKKGGFGRGRPHGPSKGPKNKFSGPKGKKPDWKKSKPAKAS